PHFRLVLESHRRPNLQPPAIELLETDERPHLVGPPLGRMSVTDEARHPRVTVRRPRLATKILVCVLDGRADLRKVMCEVFAGRRAGGDLLVDIDVDDE